MSDGTAKNPQISSTSSHICCAVHFIGQSHEKDIHVQATAPFTGLWIPLVTPFLRGEVDYLALRKLVQHLVPQGIAGIVVCGSTGEAAALSKDEQLKVLESVADAAKGLPLVMGVSGYNLNDTLDWVRVLTQRQLSGLLVSAPHYIRPSQAGLVQWFAAIAHASTIPVIIYDIPVRTGVHLHLDTLRELAKVDRICAIKDCGGDPAKTQALIAEGELQVLAGDDVNIFQTLALGGSGAIAASGHVHTRLLVDAMGSIARGDLARAQALWRILLPLITAVFSEPNPAPIKALLAHQGFMESQLRAPMTNGSPELVARLVAISASIAAVDLVDQHC